MKTKLAPRVYYKHGAYYFVTLDRKWVRLGKTESEAYQALAAIKTIGGATMHAHIEQYLHDITPTKAVTTQKQEFRIAKNLIKSFGEMLPTEIRPNHVFQYHQARTKKTRDGADREKSLLSSIMNRLMMTGIVDKNPCIGVKKNGSRKRERYVSDAEYKQVRDMAPCIIQSAMDIALLTGLRMSDILSLTNENIKKDGIHIQTSKTGRKMIYKWSDALIDAVAHARESSNNGAYIISNKMGQRFTASGFKSAWQRLSRRAATNGIERFQFRDLRTKAACDTKGNATKLLGHSSDRVTKRFYEILPWEVEPTR